MIAQVNTTQRRTRFGNACRGKWVLDALLPLDLALFGKSQPWRFYVVKSPDMKAELHRCYNREWFTSAPLYIVCCIRHDEAWVRPSDHKEHGDIDIAIAAEHICLAAAAIGLGSCWVCNFDASLCKEILQLPAEEEPAVIVPIGHTSPDCPQKEKVRKPLSEIVTYR